MVAIFCRPELIVGVSVTELSALIAMEITEYKNKRSHALKSPKQEIIMSNMVRVAAESAWRSDLWRWLLGHIVSHVK